MKRHLLGNQHGSALLFTTVMLVLLFVFGGIAIELTYFGSTRGELQRSMDAAALAGAGNLGFDQTAFRSSDRGLTWTRIRGYNFKWGQRVIADPADASKIYVTTFGGSVWHGPAQGDPNATEDVVR